MISVMVTQLKTTVLLNSLFQNNDERRINNVDLTFYENMFRIKVMI